MKKVFLTVACFLTMVSVNIAQEIAQEKPTEVKPAGEKSAKGKPAREKPAKGKSAAAKSNKAQQIKNTPEQRAQKSADELNSEVPLNDDQKAKVRELAMVRATKVDEVRAKYKGQPENKEVAKKEIEVIKKEYRTSVKALLTPEQLETLKTKHKEKKAAKKLNSLETND